MSQPTRQHAAESRLLFASAGKSAASVQTDDCTPLTSALKRVELPLPSWRLDMSAASKFCRSGREKRRLPPPPQNNALFHESRYKTELCRQFEELGECEYGDRCLFAHGLDELKNIPHRHPKFKTEKCSAYSENGFCSFGPRCSFIHEKPDAVQILMRLQESVQHQVDSIRIRAQSRRAEPLSVMGRMAYEAALLPGRDDRRLPVFTQFAP